MPEKREPLALMEEAESLLPIKSMRQPQRGAPKWHTAIFVISIALNLIFAVTNMRYRGQLNQAHMSRFGG